MQMKVPNIPFDDDCAVVQQQIERVYGIKVVTRDIPDPLTGDLDGLEIHIDCAITAEQRLFLLVHLFGHTVQWNLDPGAFDIGKQYCPPVAENLIPRIIEYEYEAPVMDLHCARMLASTASSDGSLPTAHATRHICFIFIAQEKRRTSAVSGRTTFRSFSPSLFRLSRLREERFGWMAL